MSLHEMFAYEGLTDDKSTVVLGLVIVALGLALQIKHGLGAAVGVMGITGVGACGGAGQPQMVFISALFCILSHAVAGKAGVAPASDKSLHVIGP
jgi:hypothetical protein